MDDFYKQRYDEHLEECAKYRKEILALNYEIGALQYHVKFLADLAKDYGHDWMRKMAEQSLEDVRTLPDRRKKFIEE